MCIEEFYIRVLDEYEEYLKKIDLKQNQENCTCLWLHSVCSILKFNFNYLFSFMNAGYNRFGVFSKVNHLTN